MDSTFTRREFLRLASMLTMLPLLGREASVAAITPNWRLPADLPPGVVAVLAAALRRDPASLDTDWGGSLLMYGLLLWSKRGVREVEPFARAWLNYHLQAKDLTEFSGPPSKTIRVGGMLISTYVGYYSLAFPCYEMAQQFGDRRARQVCVDVANAILHQSTRNRLGMVNQDDVGAFTIPDTCYFVAPPLMLAAELNPENRPAYQEQALFQLRTYVDVFLDRDCGLAKTVLWKDGLGKTYWTRSSGWLLWAMVGVMCHLPADHPQFEGFRKDLGRLAEGIARVQDASGGWHVLLDDPSTPLESTGTAMFATGMHEAVRRGWLSSSFAASATRAWDFVKDNITPDGNIIRAYTGWAVPAENRVMSMDGHKKDWVPGLILRAADEMLPRAVAYSNSLSR